MAEMTTGRDGLRDIVVEAVNAKDPDLFSLADDIEVPPSLFDRTMQVMERWPRMMLSRGKLDAEPVAAVWLPDDEGRYARVGHLEFDIEDGSARMEIIEEADPDLITEPPAGLEVADWEDASAVGEGWLV